MTIDPSAIVNLHPSQACAVTSAGAPERSPEPARTRDHRRVRGAILWLARSIPKPHLCRAAVCLLLLVLLPLASGIGAALLGTSYSAAAAATTPTPPPPPPTNSATPPPVTVGGVVACELGEGIPPMGHPIRRAGALRSAFSDWERAGSSPRRQRSVYKKFHNVLRGLYAKADRIFHPGFRYGQAPGDRKMGSADGLDQDGAQRFLSRYVLGKNPILSIGRDGFEPRPPVAATMAVAACRGGLVDEAIDLSRAMTGPAAGPLRGFAALLLWSSGRTAEAQELVAHLGEEGFVAPFMGAELHNDPKRRLALHAIAQRRVTTPAQHQAIVAQRRRLDAAMETVSP